MMIRIACPEIAAIPFGEHKNLINQLAARGTRKVKGIYNDITTMVKNRMHKPKP